MIRFSNCTWRRGKKFTRSEEHTSELQSQSNLVCRLLLETKSFETLVLLSFGAAALLLAMLGIYGVLSYSVVTRKQEIGVRMALGPTRGKVYALAFAEAGSPVFAGVITGLVASLLASRAIQNLLYGTRAVDPPVILIVTGLFLLSAVAAAFLPAQRAASVEPMEALRSE